MGIQARERETWLKSVVGQCAAWLVAAIVLVGCAGIRASDPLPSWNEGAAKAAIVRFVADTTRPGSAGFVPVAERIATFDNDGTLWTEHPMYVEVLFTVDRIKAMAAANPAWRDEQPFKTVIEGDRAALAKLSEADFFKLIAATHAGRTSAQFQKEAADWLAVTRHPRFNRPYTELVYQPMLEVLAFFRANGYRTYIVSGGTLDFIRSFADKAYGIPPEQVIGTSFDAKYAFAGDVATVTAEPKLMLLDDGPGKAIGIDHVIGRVPIAAFGNSDGDLAMLQTTTNSPASTSRPRLAAFVWHTDAVREYAYDRNTSVGRLSEGLDLAPRLSWLLIDMKNDWKVIFPHELKP
ncbi:MAG: haloacid dehalogenase-like hydrolase [Burkholderiales bacterium]|nr:haloacid dehalogenase-like hydrolase [Burkholderiales bacterium]